MLEKLVGNDNVEKLWIIMLFEGRLQSQQQMAQKSHYENGRRMATTSTRTIWQQKI